MPYLFVLLRRERRHPNEPRRSGKMPPLTLSRWAQTSRRERCNRVVIRVPFSAILHDRERLMTLGTILIIILILILIGALPTWGYSSGWGYGPGGAVGVILVIVIILILLGRL